MARRRHTKNVGRHRISLLTEEDWSDDRTRFLKLVEGGYCCRQSRRSGRDEECHRSRDKESGKSSGEKWKGSRQLCHERCTAHSHAHFSSDPVAVVLKLTKLTHGAHFSIFTVQGRIEKSFHRVIRR